LTSNVITYTGVSLTLTAGQIIDVTGFTAADLNVNGATIVSANATTVTVSKVAANVVTETTAVTATVVNRITYAKVAANVAVANVVAPGRIQLVNSTTEVRSYPVAVTALTDTVAGEAYNVPGSLTYNADNVIDNIIIANETGTTSSN
jgi:hypothetical protein